MTSPTGPTILPDHASLHLVRLEAEEQFILAVVATTASEAFCPLCQCRCENIHSRYVRLVADLPWAGWAVRLELHVRRFFCQHKACVRQIFTERLPGVAAPYARCTIRLTDLFTLIGFALGTERMEAQSLKLHQERVERYHSIHDRAAKKIDVASIAHQLGVSRQTVYTYLQMKQPPARTRIYRKRDSLIGPYKDYLIRRWNEGCRSAQQMYREIAEQAYSGSNTAVGRFVAPLRAKKGTARSFKSVEPELATMVKPEEVKKKRPPTALQVAHWMTFKEDQRLEWQQTYLTQLCEADPQIQETYELIQEFTIMLRERKGKRFDVWLSRVAEQGVSELQSFASGLKKDYDAVKAGLTLEWRNGQTEGQVHRLKLLKRQMYGRGHFDLLRKRVLKRA